MSYRIAPAPKFASMRTWDCSRCGRAEVKPVFLDDGNGSAAYGSGCAALVLGYPTPARVRREFDAVEAEARRVEEIRAERRARYTIAAAQFAADPNGAPTELASARRTFHTSGGATVLGSFPTWLAQVAATGDLDS